MPGCLLPPPLALTSSQESLWGRPPTVDSLWQPAMRAGGSKVELVEAEAMAGRPMHAYHDPITPSAAVMLAQSKPLDCQPRRP